MMVDRTMRQAKSWVDFLSPMIIEGLATGRFPKLSVTKMVEVSTPIWSEQHALLGVEG